MLTAMRADCLRNFGNALYVPTYEAHDSCEGDGSTDARFSVMASLVCYLRHLSALVGASGGSVREIEKRQWLCSTEAQAWRECGAGSECDEGSESGTGSECDAGSEMDNDEQTACAEHGNGCAPIRLPFQLAPKALADERAAEMEDSAGDALTASSDDCPSHCCCVCPECLTLHGRHLRRPLVFLDVDGVLNTVAMAELSDDPDALPVPPYAPAPLSRSRLLRLARLVHRFDCELVISSTWRQTVDARAALLEGLAWAGIGCQRVVGSTPEHSIRMRAAWTRAREIGAWLDAESHASIASRHPRMFIAIDDLPLEAHAPDLLSGHAVLTGMGAGFDATAAHRAATLLLRQLARQPVPHRMSWPRAGRSIQP